MNEQRLAELEARGDDFAKEIAAALREAWRERDEARLREVDKVMLFMRQRDDALERANRAESSLRKLREAAEAVIPWGSGIDPIHASFPQDDRVIPFQKLLRLSRALDAAQDPAR